MLTLQIYATNTVNIVGIKTDIKIDKSITDSNKRIEGVDFFKIISIAAVVAIHTKPFASNKSIEYEWCLAILTNQLLRFAVPFFFVISGFLWASKIKSANLWFYTTRATKKMAVFFVAWSLVYLLPLDWQSWAFAENAWDALFNNFLANISHLTNNFYYVLMNGTMDHLWFIPSLISCMVISAVFAAKNKWVGLFILSLVLYLIGLMGKAYSVTPWGLNIDFNFRNGPFFGLVFFVSGCLLQRRGINKNWFGTGLILFFAGAATHFFEINLILKIWGGTLMQDFVFGTYFFGLGAAIIALSNPPWLRISWAPKIAELVFGVYAIHILILLQIRYFGRNYNGIVWWDIGFTLAVVALSFLFSYYLYRHRKLRFMVN